MFLRKIIKYRNTLLFRLSFLYAVILLILSSGVFFVFYYRIHSLTMGRMDEELLHEIEEYSSVMAEDGLEGVEAAVAEEARSEVPDEEFVRLISLSGEVLATTDLSSWGPVDQYNALAEIKKSEGDYVYQTLTIPDREHKARMISAIIGDGAVLQIGESLQEADEYLGIFRELFLILMLVLIFVSSIVGGFMAKRALADMEEVTQTAQEISEGAFDRRVQIEGQMEEIKRLGDTFNRMLDRIQILLRSMREINDNIAHDLRSPLARIRGIAEMTLVKEKSMDDFRAMAVNTMEECDSLINMINTMLDITEAEAGVGEIEREEFNLAELIKEACELFRPMAEEKKIVLKTNLPEAVSLYSDKRKTQRVVTNILENAIKYTTDQGSVSVSAASVNGQVEIIFEDSGMGIPEADLPRIFERFYRCDRSRSQDGVGLGLSLAKAYAEAMNGSIHVKSMVNQGSTFTVRFAR